jgi:NDP-sugar pyrophosphorylase family protein
LGGQVSILEVVLMQLAKAGFTHVTLAVNHLAHLIMAYFGDGSKWGILIDYSLENEPLSTIGPLTLIENLPENFLVMNGDILCNLNFKEFYDQHVTQSSEVSVSTFQREAKVDFGVLKYDENMKLYEFEEKPTYEVDVSMGIYCLSKNMIDKLPKGKPYGFDNLMLDGIKNNTNIRISPFRGYWLDIGRPDDYEYADQNFEELSKKLGIL